MRSNRKETNFLSELDSFAPSFPLGNKKKKQGTRLRILKSHLRDNGPDVVDVDDDDWWWWFLDSRNLI